MKTLSTIAIVSLLVIIYGFVKARPVDETGKYTRTPTSEMVITRKPVVTREPTVTPPPYP